MPFSSSKMNAINESWLNWNYQWQNSCCKNCEHDQLLLTMKSDKTSEPHQQKFGGRFAQSSPWKFMKFNIQKKWSEKFRHNIDCTSFPIGTHLIPRIAIQTPRLAFSFIQNARSQQRKQSNSSKTYESADQSSAINDRGSTSFQMGTCKSHSSSAQWKSPPWTALLVSPQISQFWL